MSTAAGLQLVFLSMVAVVSGLGLGLMLLGGVVAVQLVHDARRRRRKGEGGGRLSG